MLVFSIIASALKKSGTGLGDEEGRGREAILDGVVSKGLSLEVTFEQRCEGSEKGARGLCRRRSLSGQREGLVPTP